jgi:hypothetical protein
MSAMAEGLSETGWKTKGKSHGFRVNCDEWKDSNRLENFTV